MVAQVKIIITHPTDVYYMEEVLVGLVKNGRLKGENIQCDVYMKDFSPEHAIYIKRQFNEMKMKLSAMYNVVVPDYIFRTKEGEV